MTGFIECIDVGKIYQGRTGDVEALRGISIACAAGEFVCLLGLSGCGKSTLLQMIAGPSVGLAGRDCAYFYGLCATETRPQ